MEPDGVDTVLGISPNGDTHEVRKDGTTGKRIDEIYALLTVDEEGGEGIMGFSTGPQGWMPIISSDRAHIEALTERHGKPVGELMNMTVRMVQFTSRTDLALVHEHDPEKPTP